jgi:hypothetical protein
MNTGLDILLLASWIAGIVYIARQATRKPPSAARTGPRGRRQRARSGNGGMSVRFTPPPRYHPDEDQSPEPAQAEGSRAMVVTVEMLPSDQFARALAGLTPALLCTLCVIELKQARAAGEPDPEVHPGVVMGDVVVEGRPSTAVVCEVRHPLTLATVADRPLLATPADA